MAGDVAGDLGATERKGMKILALDLATTTGWAFLRGDQYSYESGTMTLDLKRGESPGMRFVRFNKWLKEMLDDHTPELVIYEQAHHRGGAATELCVGLVTRVQEACSERSINYQKLHSNTLKKFATGSGRASKDDMLARAREHWGWNIEDHNQADALWLMEWAKKEYGNDK